MPKQKSSVLFKLKSWIQDDADFKLDGENVFCSVCSKMVSRVILIYEGIIH